MTSRPKHLTPAEARVMRAVWDLEEDLGESITVREVYEYLAKSNAYTTVMSVMDKLARKGFLEQRKTTSAYYYRSTCSDTEVAEEMIGDIVENILGKDTKQLTKLAKKMNQGAAS